MLKDLEFSDIILLLDGLAYLKGTPGSGQHLVPIPDELKSEVNDLLDHVKEQFKGKDKGASPRIKHMTLFFRAAAFEDVNFGSAFFMRRLADSVPNLPMIGYSTPMVNWLTNREQCNKGLLLFSGGQGAGKTTSAASFIQERLRLYGGHAVSFENPVEMPLAGAHGDFGRCFQTEIESEAELAYHIERAHRYSSPNIIYIGEIRSKYAASESLRVALGSKQQLVVATIHGLSIITALNRLLTWAVELDGKIAYQNLAQTLVGIIHQELVDEEEKEGIRDGKVPQRTLQVPEYMFVPFHDNAKHIRSLLADGNLDKLKDEIRSQRNRAAFSGSIEL